MARYPKLIAKNRLGCFVISIIMLAAVLLFVAIGQGWLGDVDMSKITGLPVSDNQM